MVNKNSQGAGIMDRFSIHSQRGGGGGTLKAPVTRFLRLAKAYT